MPINAESILGWFYGFGREYWDRRKVVRWLQNNTQNEPSKSHVDIVTIAKGARLSEARVRQACMTDDRIHRFAQGSELWSVWRKAPASVYEKRGLLSV